MYAAQVTLRVTAIQPSFKNNGVVRFRGVRVNKETHLKESSIDFYFIKAHEDKLSIDLTVGQIWTVTGDAKFEEKPSHNGNYTIKEHTIDDVQKCSIILPKSSQGFVEFIANDKQFVGIGPQKAPKLWKEFGSTIFDILESKDVKTLQKVLTEQSAVKLIEGYEKYSYLKYSVWLADKNIPLSVQKRIFKFTSAGNNGERTNQEGMTYNVDPIKLIKDNPYALSTFGLPFKETDLIAKNHFDIGAHDERRLIAAVTDALRKHISKGHTVAQHHDIQAPIKALLGCKELASKALSGAYDKRAYIIYPETGCYQFTPTYVMENVVAKRLLKLKNIPSQYNEAEHAACTEAFAKYDFLVEQQIEAVLTSVENSVSCITGGAGTGKTTVLNTVLTAYKALGYSIKAMALSGRAAMRMRESIQMPTHTIAKFLSEDPMDDYGKHLLVIDEASMLDLPTMYRIVIHTAPTVRFLLVGDPNQLPPIGAGNILADVVKSKTIPNTMLNIVKRQEASSGIPEYSKSINDGIVPPALTTGCITFHDVDYDDVAGLCVQLYKQEPDSSRVVAPTNALVDKINKQCQEEINPDGKQLIYQDGDGQFFYDNLYRNDPVLFTQNNYDVGVQNGSLGKLISVEQTDKHLGSVKMDDSDEDIELTQSLLLSLKPGYAITLHKAQGSQFPRVIVALSRGSNLDRAWLYTAITRAESEIHIVGPHEKVVSAINNVSNASKRKTYLVPLLQQRSDN
jgi:exodeoxyribonuclease V alpha subunit